MLLPHLEDHGRRGNRQEEEDRDHVPALGRVLGRGKHLPTPYGQEPKTGSWEIRRGHPVFGVCRESGVGRTWAAPDDRSVPSGLTDSVVQGQGVILAAARQEDGLGLAAARQPPLG